MFDLYDKHVDNSPTPESKNRHLFFTAFSHLLILPLGLSSPLLFLIDLLGDSPQLDVLYTILQLVMSFCFSSPVRPPSAGSTACSGKRRKHLETPRYQFAPERTGQIRTVIRSQTMADTAGLPFVIDTCPSER